MAASFMAEVRRNRNANRRNGIDLDTGVYAVLIADIKKALKPRQRLDLKIKLPIQYHEWLKAFN
jgi:hypothetical protein